MLPQGIDSLKTEWEFDHDPDETDLDDSGLLEVFSESSRHAIREDEYDEYADDDFDEEEDFGGEYADDDFDEELEEDFGDEYADYEYGEESEEEEEEEKTDEYST